MPTSTDLYGEAELARRILRAAQESGMRVGGRLPTERTLADDLGVSRTVIRHALARLEAAGVISREVGRGTFIRRFDPAGESDAADDVGPADVMAVRLLLEPQAMPIVVARATGRDFDEMRRCLDRCLMAAGHNPLLLRLYSCVETARHGQLWGDLKRRNDSTERRAQYRGQHHLVVAALRSRDSEAAVAAMHTHLTTVRANLLGSNA